MAERIKMVGLVMMGVVGMGLLYAAMSTVTTMGHLLTVADCYGRVVVLRGFEIAYRLYSLPL